MHPVIASYLANVATIAPIAREGVRSKPFKHSASAAEPALKEAFQKRIEELGVSDPVIKLSGVEPNSFEEALQTITSDPKKLGAHQKLHKIGEDGKPIVTHPAYGSEIHYNRHGDSAVLAHELGHAVGQRTDIGSFVNKLRGNPKLATAIAIASGLLPISAAALTPGDDEYDEAMAGTLALASPKLIDEALATKNALAMMDTAGMRATLGQRGKLAAGLLSYAAAPLVAASVGTAIGNQFDENV